jgi:hypothetical protein
MACSTRSGSVYRQTVQRRGRCEDRVGGLCDSHSALRRCPRLPFWQYRQASSMPKAERRNPIRSCRRGARHVADDSVAGSVRRELPTSAVYKELRTTQRNASVIQLLDATSKTRFGEDAPSYRMLRLAVETVSKLVEARGLESRAGCRPVSASETNGGDDRVTVRLRYRWPPARQSSTERRRNTRHFRRSLPSESEPAKSHAVPPASHPQMGRAARRRRDAG